MSLVFNKKYSLSLSLSLWIIIFMVHKWMIYWFFERLPSVYIMKESLRETILSAYNAYIKGVLLSVLWPPTITLTLVACVYVFWGSQMSITGCFVAVICNLVCQTRQLFASHSWEVCSSRFDSLRRGGGNTECSKIQKKNCNYRRSSLYAIFVSWQTRVKRISRKVMLLRTKSVAY